MKTERISAQPHFNGYYRLANKLKDSKIINEEYLPQLQTIDQHIQNFSGNNPLAPYIMDMFENCAKLNNASVNWVKNNAQNYNVNVPLDNFDVIYIITGEKDTKEVIQFSDNLLAMGAKSILKRMFKIKFGIKSKEHISGEPSYIEDLRMLSKTYNKAQDKFDKFIETKDVVNCDSMLDFLKAFKNEISG